MFIFYEHNNINEYIHYSVKMSTFSYDSGNINNILEDTIQRFFTDYSDNSLNFLREYVTLPPLNLSIEEEDSDSMPDLIESPAPVQDAPAVGSPAAPSDRGMELWANVLDNYHTQMRMYQENVRTILDITQTFLPSQRERASTNPSSILDLLRNNTYSVEIERLIPSLFPNRENVSPTALQIASATTTFTCDLSNNPISSQVCPISLEEFRDGEQLTRIRHCGHLFKTVELSRWFTRNAHCPSCRFDIRQNS